MLGIIIVIIIIILIIGLNITASVSKTGSEISINWSHVLEWSDLFKDHA